MSLYFWTVVPLVLVHLICVWRYSTLLRFQLLLDIILFAVVGPALVSGDDLNPVRCVENLPPFRAVEWSPQTQLQRTQSDVVFQFHPWWEQTRIQLRHGQAPAIQPAAGGGLPLLANGQTGVLAPVMAPVWVLGPERGTTVMAFWKIELAGLGAFLLMLRVWRLGRTAASVAGLAWAGSPYLVGWLLVPLAWVTAFLPWAWWLMWWTLRRRAPAGAPVLTGSIFGWVLGAGLHPETAAVVCGSALLMALITRPRRWPRSVATGLACSVVAIVLAWPTVGLIAASSRHDIGHGGNANRDRLPWSMQRDLAQQIVLPAAQGHPARGDWRPAYPHAPGAAGMAGAVLGLVGLAAVRRRYRRLALTAVSVAVIGLVLLVRIPPLDAVLVRIPPLDQMTLARFGVLVPWGCILLAALALDGARHGRERILPFRLLPGAIAAAVALWAGPWRLATVDALLVVLSVVTAVGVAVLRRRRLVPVMVGIELALLAWGINPTAAVEDRLPRPEVLERLFEMESTPPARVVGLGLMLPPNLASRYGLRDLRASDPLRPTPFVRLMEILGEPPTVLGGPLADLPPGLCGAWGVGFALAPPRRDLPGWHKVFSDDDGAIWSNPAVLEEVRVVGRVRMEPESIDEVKAVVARTDFTSTALVRSEIGPIRADETSVDVGMRLPARLEANVECDGPCLLVMAQPWAPGWHATVSGEPSEIVLADIAGIGVRVPRGRHRVELAYEPWRWWPQGRWPAGVGGDR